MRRIEKQAPGLSRKLAFFQCVSQRRTAPLSRLAFVDQPKQLRHLLVQKSLAWTVGLNPSAIDHELGDCTFAGMADDFLGGAWGGFDVDLLVRDVVFVEEALRGAT